MQSSLSIHSQLIVSRKLLWWHLEKSYTKKVYVSLRPPPTTLNGGKNWVPKSLEAAKTPNDSNQNQKPHYQERRDPWVDNRSPRRSKKMSCLVAKAPNTQQERETCGWIKIHPELRVNACTNCRQIRGRRSNKNGRPVGGHWSTQEEETDIDVRVPGLSHAVVKEAENFLFQELVKKIESHPHRGALQADLQQNNVYNPFSEKSKKMIRELANVELFELCETVPKSWTKSKLTEKHGPGGD